ncbi:putative membrane protein [Klebsiella aerogenes]|nr:putative membrane protein [Klebsiella aerogenes]
MPNKKTLNMRYLRFVTTSVLLLVLIVFFVVLNLNTLNLNGYI